MRGSERHISRIKLDRFVLIMVLLNRADKSFLDARFLQNLAPGFDVKHRAGLHDMRADSIGLTHER